VANVANLVLELLFVYGFGWGIAGSAAGTVIAQLGMGLAFVVELVRPHALSRRPSLTTMKPLFAIGRQIFVRTLALYASFLVAASVLARMGDAQIGAHQIAYELFIFIALVLDAVAIAGQVIVGRMLGAGDADGEPDPHLAEELPEDGALRGIVVRRQVDHPDHQRDPDRVVRARLALEDRPRAATDLAPADIVKKALEIAGELCIYTNMHHTVETL